MLTLVHILPSKTPSRETASLVAEYVAFERKRTASRQYMKAFGGMALLVLLGAAFGRVPQNEALIVGGMLVTPPAILGGIEFVQWRRLLRRLDHERAEVQEIRKS